MTPNTLAHQLPSATDVLLDLNVPCSGDGAAARLEIDKLPDGRYRAIVGFEHEEICRTGDLEALVRQANAMAGCPIVRQRGCRVCRMTAPG